MNRGRPAPQVDPSPSELRSLAGWVADPATPSELALRARIVMRCARGESNVAVARALDVTRETVSKWRRRFARSRLAGLFDDPRPGAPSALDKTDVERVRARARQAPSEGERWTTRALARDLDLTQTAVSRILRVDALEPGTSPSPFMPGRGLDRARVRALAGLYVDPPVRAFALEYDERAEAPAAGTGTETLPLERVGCLASLDAHARKASRHGSGALRWEPFLDHLERLEARLAPGCSSQVVLAGYAPQKRPRVARWLAEHPRVVAHAIPTSGTWLELLQQWAAAVLLPAPESELDPARSLAAAVDAHLTSESLGRTFRWISPAVRTLVHVGDD